MIYKEFLTKTLNGASEIANKMFGKVSGRIKDYDVNQVLTDADLAVGKFISEQIEKEYSNHNIIDEETGVIDKKSDYTWVIDPIDGTANFAVGIPLYGIMLGLLKSDKPIAGGFSLPYFDQTYLAEQGQGAFCNGEKLEMHDQLDFSKIMVAYGIEKHKDNPGDINKEAEVLVKIVEEFLLVRNIGSVFDVGMLVKGGYGAVYNNQSQIWDNVAQQIVVEEAGGIYTDFYGKPMDYSRPLTKTKLNYTYCAGAPSVHKKLQEIIYKINPSSWGGGGEVIDNFATMTPSYSPPHEGEKGRQECKQ